MTTLPNQSAAPLASPALLTDLYQLTMAAGYWREGLAEREAVFHLTFRRPPFGGAYAVACGLHSVVELLNGYRFSRDDIDYLSGLTGQDGAPLFSGDFLGYLQALTFECDVAAIPEGTVVFAHEPLIRVTGPLLQAQLIETALLNLVNFQTLIATKAARICRAAQGDSVLEFGLRRAQGVDGGISASRAAYVGGCAATSNVWAAKRYGIPVRGTHAHSWVMAHDDEVAAFEAYARAMPNNCLLLVDTYDTLAGVDRAIEVGLSLRDTGHRLIGVRLDSGDLVALSREARRRLDAAGMQDAAIVASNDLDEFEITKLKRDGARIDTWGVGTRLATAYDQPALGGVYKLAAIRAAGGQWKYCVKLSEQAIKVSTPGTQQVRRFCAEGKLLADVIFDADMCDGSVDAWVPFAAPASNARAVPPGADHQDLLEPIFRRGRLVYQPPAAAEVRSRTQQQLAVLPPTVAQLSEPAEYDVGLEMALHGCKMELLRQRRESPAEGSA